MDSKRSTKHLIDNLLHVERNTYLSTEICHFKFSFSGCKVWEGAQDMGNEKGLEMGWGLEMGRDFEIEMERGLEMG